MLCEFGEVGVWWVDVFCFGFMVDCLEMIEEIGMEVCDEFFVGGGKIFYCILCLNGVFVWIGVFGEIVVENL